MSFSGNLTQISKDSTTHGVKSYNVLYEKIFPWSYSSKVIVMVKLFFWIVLDWNG